MQFQVFGLDKRLNETIDHFGFDAPTPIQAEAIPVAIRGRDLMASSKTGSGKTLAYLLPLLNRLLRIRALSKKDPRALILLPTRELAKQVADQVRSFTANTQLKFVKVFGGENFNDQEVLLRRHPHIIIATPGRLSDHIKHGNLYLEGLELLVLDEADRMLDLGFAKELMEVNRAANHRRRQTLMFSATLDHVEVMELSQQLLNNPHRITIDKANADHLDIAQSFVLADHLDHKHELLNHLVNTSDFRQMIVFTATRDDTDKLADMLRKTGKECIALSGDMSQSARNRIMDQFAKGGADILVTTDVASRGLDLVNVSHVVNFDLPKHSEEYVHRIGRTGRAGAKGTAISLVGPKDWKSFKSLETFLEKTISFDEIEGMVAKFKGFKIKPKKAFKPKTDQKPRHTKPVKKRKPVKRDKSFYEGEEGGFGPLKKKKKPIPPEQLDNDE